MDRILRNAMVYRPSGFMKSDILIRNGVIERIAPQIPPLEGIFEEDWSGFHILPGLVDVHVHFREPGFSCKETIHAGSRAATLGVSMPPCVWDCCRG